MACCTGPVKETAAAVHYPGALAILCGSKSVSVEKRQLSSASQFASHTDNKSSAIGERARLDELTGTEARKIRLRDRVEEPAASRKIVHRETDACPAVGAKPARCHQRSRK